MDESIKQRMKFVGWRFPQDGIGKLELYSGSKLMFSTDIRDLPLKTQPLIDFLSRVYTALGNGFRGGYLVEYIINGKMI